METILFLYLFTAVITCIGSVDAECPNVCQCLNGNTAITCTDHVLSNPPRLPTSAIEANLLNLYLGPILNASFSYMRRLSHLDLSRNYIARISSHVFNGLQHLTSLDLSHNRIQELEVDLFLDNQQLEILDLSHNAMTSLNGVFYRNLPNLKQLKLVGNNFFQLKLGLRFQVLNQLQLLDLSRNDFGDIKDDAFENIDQWNNNIKRTLRLVNCSITSVENGTFVPFRGLYDLDLMGTKTLTSDNISVIVKDLQHTDTKRLHVSYLQLSNIDTIFTGAPKLSLEYLNLSHNNIDRMSPDSFSHLGSLKYLDISHNKMKLFPDAFSTLSNVHTLDVSHNDLKAFNGTSVSQLSSLQVLLAGHNKFSKRSQVQVDSLQHLRVLDLSHNDLSALITAGDNAKLEELILSGNNISSLDTMPESPSLRKLDVSRNKLTSLGPYMFSAAVNIEIVDFSNNLISIVDHLAFLPNSTNAYIIDLSGNRLKSVHFGGWASARVLNLSKNRISLLDFHAFQGMNDLEELDLSSNALEEVHDDTFKYLINLRTLNLAHNRLESSVKNPKIKETFATLVELRSIDMSFNNLTYLDPNVFSDNGDLVNISLARNKFSTISPEIFEDMEYLENLDISGNPFICDCAILPLVKWLKRLDPSLYHAATKSHMCAGPFYRTSQDIFHFQVKFFECDENLLNLIVFGSLGVLTIIVGIVGTVVCRSYQKWSEGIVSKKRPVKKDSNRHKSKQQIMVEELPFEIINELDQSLKTKLWKQNASRHIANGGPALGKHKPVKNHKTKGSKENKRSRSRSQSKHADDKRSRSRSRSKSKDRSKSHERVRLDKRDKEQIRRFEKELQLTLARYNQPRRRDYNQRDRWATLGHWDWVNRRDYNPERADRFYTMPSNRRRQQTLLDDTELARKSSGRGSRPSLRRPLPVRDRSPEARDYSARLRKISPAYRYDVVRVGTDNDVRPRRENSQSYQKHHHRYPDIQYPQDGRKPVRRYDDSMMTRPRGDKRRYDGTEMGNILYVKPEAPKLASRRTEREYVELPFPDVRESRNRRWEQRSPNRGWEQMSSQPDLEFVTHACQDSRISQPDLRDESRVSRRAPPRASLPFLVTEETRERDSESRSRPSLQCNRSRSYSDIDFQSKRRRYEQDAADQGGQPRSIRNREDSVTPGGYETDMREGRNDPRSQVNGINWINDPRTKVKVEVHKERHCQTPDPDYPIDNPKLTEWL